LWAFWDRIDNLNFGLLDFQIGMGIGAVAMIFELAFTRFFPTWAWLGYAYKISLNAHPLTLFSIFSKIGLEIYHQVEGESFPNQLF
jgi:hypothetical protein